MGSNMQRQGVPLLVSEAPIIGTGLEGRVARDSRAVIVSESAWQDRLRRFPAHHRHQGRRAPRGQEEDQERPRGRRLRLRTAQVHALQQQHLHQPAPDRQEVADGEEGRRAGRRPQHRERRTRPRPQHARRLHALERLQLRGRDPHLRARRQGGHLHLHPHRRVRDRRPRHQARSRGNHPRHSRMSARRPSRTSDPTASSASAPR